MPSEVLLGTNRFIAVADVAPLAKGHILVFPRRHILGLSLLSDEDCAELEGLRLTISKILRASTGVPAISFEHGLCDPSRRSGCGIDHAHLHIIPNPGDVSGSLTSSYECREVDSVRALPETVTDSTEEYLFLIDQNDRCLLAEVEEPTRQFFRRVISEILDNEFWNWDDQVSLADPAKLREDILATHRMFDRRLV